MQAEERVALAGMLLQGMTPRAIAMALKRSPSTISRLLARNSSGSAYVSRGAQASCEARLIKARPAQKRDPDGPLWPLVTHMLGYLFSPPGVRNQAPLLRLRCIPDTLRKSLLAGPCF